MSKVNSNSLSATSRVAIHAISGYGENCYWWYRTLLPSSWQPYKAWFNYFKVLIRLWSCWAWSILFCGRYLTKSQSNQCICEPSRTQISLWRLIHFRSIVDTSYSCFFHLSVSIYAVSNSIPRFLGLIEGSYYEGTAGENLGLLSDKGVFMSWQPVDENFRNWTLSFGVQVSWITIS